MMNLVLQTPSLQHIAGVRVVAALWSQPAISRLIPRDTFVRFITAVEYPTWKPIEDQVEMNLNSLLLPQLLKKQLVDFIKPIGLQIYDWYYYHSALKSDTHYMRDLFPEQFCWTMRGTVDYAKTAQLMLRNDGLDVEKRYILTCINCLEDEARHLIQQISEDRRGEFMNGFASREDEIHHCLVVYFTCTLSGRPDRLHEFYRRELAWRNDSFNEHVFKISIGRVPRATCEYFLGKLNPAEKARVLSDINYLVSTYGRMLPRPFNLLYYLSLQSEEQRERCFRRDAAHIIECFLYWPVQPLFMEVVKRGWRFMDWDRHSKVLPDIIRRINDGFSDYDYEHLFWECWALNQGKEKQRFLCHVFHLEALVRTKKEELIKLVFNDAPPRTLLDLINRFKPMVLQVLVESSNISDAFLEECVQKNKKKRLWGKCLRELVASVLESRQRLRPV